MFDHDRSFLELARMIIEGKEPPKKDKVEKDLKKDGKESAEETLAKVKKDLGVSDDKGEDGDDQGSKKKVDDTGKVGGDKGNEDGSTDTSDHPDDPSSTGGDENPESGAPQDPPKKEPKRPDVSKDPFKGDKDGGKKDAKDSSQGSGEEGEGEPSSTEASDKPKGTPNAVAGDDQSSAPTGKKDPAKTSKSPQASDKDEAETDPEPKNDATAGGQKSQFNDGDRPAAADGDKDDEDAEGSGDDSDGAALGKKEGEEDPDGDDSDGDDNADGKDNGDEVDGSSKSEVNLTPKIKDEPLGEAERLMELSRRVVSSYVGKAWSKQKKGKIEPKREEGVKKAFDKIGGKAKVLATEQEGSEVSFVEKVRASRLRTKALMEARDEQAQIQDFLDEGFPGSIPGEWYLDDEGMYHVAVLGEDGLKDFVFEKHIGFKKLEGELGHEKGVKNPGALAAYIGRKKYGGKKMSRAAKEHKAL